MSDSFVTPWTVVRQAPLSMGFPRQEFWSGLPFHSPGDRPYSVIKSTSSVWQPDSFTTESPWKPYIYTVYIPAFQRPVVQEHRGWRQSVSQLSSQGKSKFHLLLLFSSFQVLKNLDEPHPQWAISFTLPPPPVQILTSSRNTFTDILRSPLAHSS